MAALSSSSSSPRKPASPLRFTSLALLTSLMLISLFGGGAYISHHFASPCETQYVLSSPLSSLCSGYQSLGPVSQAKQTVSRGAPPARPYTDKELSAVAFSRDVLHQPRSRPQHPKIAFMFLTRHELSQERLWEHFFQGHEGMYSIYVHASEYWNSSKSQLFAHRNIPSKKVAWGRIDMIDAERRLLAHALLDKENDFFILLSESCVPLWSFDFIYEYLMGSNISFVDCFFDPGPHGAGRYLDGMKPEVSKSDFCKGAQWFAVNRRHALLIVADSLYYEKFKSFCKPGKEYRNCYPDEHYVQTFLHIMDPMGISNWSITHVDWSSHEWHPRTYTKVETSLQLFKDIQNIKEVVHVSSGFKRLEMRQACVWNASYHPCYLFARKFRADSTDLLIKLLRNITNGACEPRDQGFCWLHMAACNENAFEAKRIMEASHTVVEIKIKTLDSQVYTCRVEKNVSVPDLKEQVALVTGVPSGSQRLICRGKVLKDEHVLSAYEVEDGHTLHLVTRPAPPPSVSAAPNGSQSDEQDPQDYASLNRPGHISHSVLVGTFNIPDRGNMVFPEINRIFSSVLSSLRVGSFFPPTLGTGNGNIAAVPPNTESAFSGGQEREENANQRLETRSVDQTTTATHQRGSADLGPSIDGFPSLHGEAGYISAIPAVSHVQIVHQIVPNALRAMSQHVNRMEQMFAANGQAQTSVFNIDMQSQQNEQGQSSSSEDGDPAAWASAIRRVQELLSNQAGAELQRLADQLEVESSLETTTARGNIQTVGMRLEQLGRLLLDLGGTALTLGRDSSQPGRGLDRTTEMPSRQSSEPMHYVDNDDIPGNMNIHIHAGLPPFLVARNFLSQATQDDPPLSLNIDNNRDSADFQNDQQTNGATNIFMQPPASLNEHGAVRASLPELFQDSTALDSANAGRGVFYPLLARFQPLNPSLFARQEDLSLDLSGTEEAPRPSTSEHHQYPSLSVLQAVVQNQVGEVVGDGEAGFSVGEHLTPPTTLHLEAQPEIGITRNGVRLGEEGFETNATDAHQDVVCPLLHVMGPPSTAAARQDEPKPEQMDKNKDLQEAADAGTSLQLNCSGQRPVDVEWLNHASKGCSFLLDNHNAATVPEETNFNELKVSGGFPSNTVQPFSFRTRLCDQLYEQACTRELQDCGRMDEVSTAASSGTVLQDFLSTLARRHDQKGDAELASEQTAQELSLVLDNVENRGLCLDSLGSNVLEVTPLPSSRCCAESLKQHDHGDIGLDTLGASSGLHNFQDETNKIAMGNNDLCSLQKSTSREFCKDLQHLFPVAQKPNKHFFNDSEGLFGNKVEDCKTVGDGGPFGTCMDNERLVTLQQLSTSAPISVSTTEDLKRHIADSSHEGLQAVKRQKML